MTFFTRLFAEPVLQFVAIGAVLFAVHTYFSGEDALQVGEPLEVGAAQVEALASHFVELTGRAATEKELHNLVEEWIDDEVAYREAIKLGLDKNDNVVRRHLLSKLTFIVEDRLALQEPTDAELQAFLQENPQRFRRHTRVSFRQWLASGDDANAQSKAGKWVAALQADSSALPQGDESNLPSAMQLASKAEVMESFGSAFALAVFDAQEGGVIGPIESPFGVHAVVIDNIESERAQDLKELRPSLVGSWQAAQKRKYWQDYRQQLREKYAISIDWPEVEIGQLP